MRLNAETTVTSSQPETFRSKAPAFVLVAVILLGALVPGPIMGEQDRKARPRVVVQTELGNIEIEIFAAQAPITAANFLKYVDAGRYAGGMFHRTVRPDNQGDNQVKIEMIQAGVNPEKAKEDFPPIPLERTSKTGLLHKNGTVSMARGAPDTATSGFFICINDQPALDFGGKRNPDGQGYAAFGQVVLGMDAVLRIQMAPNDGGQSLTPPVKIIAIKRN
jgi:peptidyl-prolyl cis-trans isomerase A (cyclophilin A)